MYNRFFKYMSVFLVAFLVVFTFFSSHNEAQAAVSPTIALGVSAIVAIASLLSLAGFSFSSRDAAFVLSKSIYDDMDSSSKSALEYTLQTLKGLHDLPYDVVKVIYDVAKSKLSSTSLSESYSLLSYDLVTGSSILTFPYIPYIRYYTARDGGYERYLEPYSESGRGGYRIYAVNDSKYYYTTYSGASSYKTVVSYDSSFDEYFVDLYIYDSSGVVLDRSRYGFYPGRFWIGSFDEIYPSVTVNPSTDFVFPSGVDTDAVAQKIASGEAGSISAPLYPSDSVFQSQSASDVLNTYLDIVLKNVSSLVDTNVQTLSAVKAISVAVSNVLSAVSSIATAITSGLVGDLSSIDFSQVIKNISIATNKFPFSIPWDLQRVLSVFNVPVQSPEFKVGFSDFRGGIREFVISFSWLDNYIGVIRTLEIISFDFLLIFVARRLANPDA